MNMNKNEMHRVPGFTADKALEQASTPHAGIASRNGQSGVEPASVYYCYHSDGYLVCCGPRGCLNAPVPYQIS
jgi:hypothetical protein